MMMHPCPNRQILPIQFHKVRAFKTPYAAAFFHQQRMQILPMFHILRFIQKDSPLPLYGTGKHHIPMPSDFQYFRIPKVKRSILRAFFNNAFFLCKVNHVFASHHPLLLQCFFAVFMRPYMAGEIKNNFIPFHNGTAGKSASYQFFGIFQNLILRRQRHRKMNPMNQIFAGSMSPVHIGPFLPVRVKLIKHMVISLKPA